MPRSLGSTQAPGSGSASVSVNVQVCASPDSAIGIVLPLLDVPYAFHDPSPKIRLGSGKSRSMCGPWIARLESGLLLLLLSEPKPALVTLVRLNI